ncbi:uncharacterized protein LOC115891615 [Sitophilus oryzae]|uniref:Uncharacterized protein LOC115891615 n=1 Tax=Sitophilus oryzae TaxID=7048 RepID=A0A6J2YXK9_SITOR|nr:uncharacterized protein LOC115891615 [Sitophilus oryzae]
MDSDNSSKQSLTNYNESAESQQNKSDSRKTFSPKLSNEDCREILKTYLGYSEFELKTISWNSINQREGNLGDYYILNIHYRINGTDQEINLFSKFLPSLNESTNSMAKSGPSEKEDFFYTALVKDFKRVGLGPYLDFFPKCYFSKVNYVLILDNLALSNYELVKPPIFYTFDMTRLTIRQLAKLHASSLVYEEMKSIEQGKEFRMNRTFGKYLKEILFQTEEVDNVAQMTIVGIKAITEYLIPLFTDIPKQISMEEFIKRSQEAFRNVYIKLKPSSQFRNTFCHGDVWTTNVLFKFNQNKSPIDCKIVDYQLTRYCPPAQDLMSHIYLTTAKESRTKYLQFFIEDYYKNLTNIIDNFGLNIEKILPKKEFLESCDYMKAEGICQALLYGPINLVEERQDVFTNQEKFDVIMLKDRSEFVKEMMEKHPYYKKTLKDLIEDLCDVCEEGLHKL